MNAIEEHLQQQILALEARVIALENAQPPKCPSCQTPNIERERGFAITCSSCGCYYYK